MISNVHENTGPAIEARPTPAGAATAETRDSSPPPSAEGAAHPDHEAPEPATDAPAATPPPVAGAPSHPWRKWLLWAGAAAALAVAGYLLVPAVETAMSTVSTDDAYVNGYVTLVAPRVPGQVARVLVHDNYRVRVFRSWRGEPTKEWAPIRIAELLSTRPSQEYRGGTMRQEGGKRVMTDGKGEHQHEKHR